MISSETSVYDKIWSDISPDFGQSWNKDVKAVRGVKALNNSLAGIIMTRKGSRPFMPDFGCDIGNSLFELMSPQMTEALKKDILLSIKKYEPRINSNKVYIEVQMDYDSNAISVNIVYALITASAVSDWKPQTFSHVINESSYNQRTL